VSQTFRAEGERAFRLVYLPSLYITWEYYESLEDARLRMTAKFTPGSCQSSELKIFIELSLILYGMTSKEELREKTRKLLDYRDTGFLKQSPRSKPCHTQLIEFHPAFCYVNHAEIPDLVYHPTSGSYDIMKSFPTKPGKISFDWRLLMNRFFAEEAYSRRVRPDGLSLSEITQAVRVLLSEAEQNMINKSFTGEPFPEEALDCKRKICKD
jgi:hypothetical protein